MKEGVYTTRQVGAYCGVDLTTVINWVKRGKVKAYKTAGGHRRIRKEDLIDFMNEHSMPLPYDLVGDDKKTNVVILTKKDFYNIEDSEYRVEIVSSCLELGYSIRGDTPDHIIVDPDALPDPSQVLKDIKKMALNSKITIINIDNRHNDIMYLADGSAGKELTPQNIPDLLAEIK